MSIDEAVAMMKERHGFDKMPMEDEQLLRECCEMGIILASMPQEKLVSYFVGKQFRLIKMFQKYYKEELFEPDEKKEEDLFLKKDET